MKNRRLHFLILLDMATLWYFGVVCYAYKDLRDFRCMDGELTEHFSQDRVEWRGEVVLTMTCEEGFDYALNTPTFGEFVCRPDGKPWQPFVFPDCNPMQTPKKLQLLIAIECLNQCPRLGEPALVDNQIILRSGDRLDISHVCNSTNAINKNCRAIQATTSICGADDVDTRTGTECSDFPKSNGSHLFVRFEFNVDPTFAYVDYKAAQSPAKQTVTNIVTFEVSVSSKLRVVCGNNTVGVLTGDGNLVCRGCSLGHYLDRSTKKCLPCPPGYYADKPLQISCKLCETLKQHSDDETVWKKVNKTCRKRNYALAQCPYLVLNDGKMELVEPPPLLFGMTTKMNNTSIFERFGSDARNDGRARKNPSLYSTYLILLVTNSLAML